MTPPRATSRTGCSPVSPDTLAAIALSVELSGLPSDHPRVRAAEIEAARQREDALRQEAGLAAPRCTMTDLNAVFVALAKQMTIALASARQLLAAFKLNPHHPGRGEMPCACHSTPWPSAAEYARRRKHRNQRRR